MNSLLPSYSNFIVNIEWYDKIEQKLNIWQIACAVIHCSIVERKEGEYKEIVEGDLDGLADKIQVFDFKMNYKLLSPSSISLYTPTFLSTVLQIVILSLWFSQN